MKCDNETGLSHSCSPDAVVSGSDAVWVFPAGAVCGDGGVWHHGVSVLPDKQGGSIVCVWRAGFAISTDIQDCTGEDGVECGGCCGGCVADSPVRDGEADRKEDYCALAAAASR